MAYGEVEAEAQVGKAGAVDGAHDGVEADLKHDVRDVEALEAVHVLPRADHVARERHDTGSAEVADDVEQQRRVLGERSLRSTTTITTSATTTWAKKKKKMQSAGPYLKLGVDGDGEREGVDLEDKLLVEEVLGDGDLRVELKGDRQVERVRREKRNVEVHL